MYIYIYIHTNCNISMPTSPGKKGRTSQIETSVWSMGFWTSHARHWPWLKSCQLPVQRVWRGTAAWSTWELKAWCHSPEIITLQETNVSHLGKKENHRLKSTFKRGYVSFQEGITVLQMWPIYWESNNTNLWQILGISPICNNALFGLVI